MPDMDEAFSKDDFYQFYSIENEATINKFRGITKIKMDKYELSKFLGKYRVVSKLIDQYDSKKFTKTIGKMFNNRELIDNYILWERIFEIFITDKNYDDLCNFIKKIISAIDSIKIKNKIDNEINVIKSLQLHLESSLNRVLSLLWGKDVEKKLIDKLKYELNFLLKDLRKEYILTRMSNKYVMSVPLEILKCPNANSNLDYNVNFTDFESSLNYLQLEGFCEESNDWEFLPYFSQAQDIATAMFLKTISKKYQYNKQEKQSIKDYINKINKMYDKDNLNQKNIIKHDKNCISIIGDKTDKLRIAVANVNVRSVTNLENRLKYKKQNRKYKRYKDLAYMVNEAIKTNCNILVFPENFIPFEWLSSLATKAARENLAIITGVEHIISSEIVYNYTAVILPFKCYNSIPTAAVFYQLKKHYSPDEKSLIEGYGYKIPKNKEKRPLYHWMGCYFPVYCCYELASINERAEFISLADMVVAVEHNKDTQYFSNIVESLSMDLHCYCVQVNTSEFGDSRIIQPTRSEEKNILNVKGGLNQTLLVGEIDISALRQFQLKNHTLRKNDIFKPIPPGINVNNIKKKIHGNFI